MKIVRFSREETISYGILDGAEVAVLAHDPLFSEMQTTGQRIRIDQIDRILAPVIPRSKVVCVGKNYADHAKEMGSSVPSEPLIFLKPNTSVIGPKETIVIPAFSERVDYEGELAVVIGHVTKNVSAQYALQHVFGYTLANDVTARDIQQRETQWTRAKGADTFCPLGPWIETKFDSEATIRTKLNGKIVQEAPISDMIFGIAEIVEFVSACFTLLPGDIILTGTPAGIGPMLPGDIVEVESDFIGTLSNVVL